jgi:phospholipid N-methyltransferase
MNDQRKARHTGNGDDDQTLGWTFFRQWLKNPLRMAAVSPSSRELAQKMLRELPHSTRRVIELGGGTGVFTRALLERGVKPEDLLVLELNETLHQHLRQSFPGAYVACADACDLARVAEQSGYKDGGTADAVVSGLGLLSMAKPTQRTILESAFALLSSQGRFVQFTYGPTNPVSREVMHDLDLHAERTGFTLWNVPPAAVYVVTRRRSKRIHPVRAAR